MTTDYEWICPSEKGNNCLNTNVPREQANLFHEVHARSFVNLTMDKGADSGVHLPVEDIRALLLDGSAHDIRILMTDPSSATWDAFNDFVMSFTSLPDALFRESSHAEFTKDTDYTVTALTNKAGDINASVICWGLNYQGDYRGYDQGLHVGTPSPEGWKTGRRLCHLKNDNGDVQLKSHYTTGGPQGDGDWYPTPYPFLSSPLQQKAGAIAIFVRAKPHDSLSLGSKENPAESCMALRAAGIAVSGTYYLRVGDEVFAAHCDMTTAGKNPLTGGWTLLAKITSDFGWICPEKLNDNCTGSTVPREQANLFDEVHERHEVGLVSNAGADSGVHLPLHVIRQLTSLGESIELRILFADDRWNAKNDVVVAFKGNPDSLFVSQRNGVFQKDLDFDVVPIKTSAGADGQIAIVCWVGRK